MRAILQMSGDKNIRIASKSIRSIGILNMIKEYSDRFQGIMCFTATEAIYLYEQGFDDLLVAYPTWDEKQLRTVCRLVKTGATITLMVDSMAHVKRLKSIAKEEEGMFLIAIDVDVSTKFPGVYFGVYRSPLRSVKKVIHLAKQIKEIPQVKLDGVMGYEAQIAGVVDQAPNQKVKNNVVRYLKKRSRKQIARKRTTLMKALHKLGISLRFVNGGGTGSLKSTHRERYVTEVTVGSGFYYPHLFDQYVDLDLEPAAFFATEITRLPRSDMYTCTGGGYVASGASNVDKLPIIHLPKGATLTENEAVGEVQTPVYYKGPINLTYGDPIIFRHSKAGELCERFQYLYLIKDNQIIDKKNTYRGDGKCFL